MSVFIASERAETIHAELLATETAHHGAVDDGAAQLGRIEIAVRGRNTPTCQIADEASGKAIAGTGGIEHRLERQRRREEDVIGVEVQRAVLAALDDHRPRSHRADRARRAHDVVLAREQARLAVVDQEHVDALEDLPERGVLALDPVVHRVHRDELRALDLVEHAELERGVDVREEHVRRAAERVRQLG